MVCSDCTIKSAAKNPSPYRTIYIYIYIYIDFILLMYLCSFLIVLFHSTILLVKYDSYLLMSEQTRQRNVVLCNPNSLHNKKSTTAILLSKRRHKRLNSVNNRCILMRLFYYFRTGFSNSKQTKTTSHQ